MNRSASPFGGVVFDLDGTLLDSMPLVLKGLARVVAPYRPRPDAREVMANLGGPSEACVRRLLGGETHVAEALAAYLKFLAEHEDTTRLLPGSWWRTCGRPGCFWGYGPGGNGARPRFGCAPWRWRGCLRRWCAAMI